MYVYICTPINQVCNLLNYMDRGMVNGVLPHLGEQLQVCSLLQRVAVCDSVLQCVAVNYMDRGMVNGVLPHLGEQLQVVCCSVLQCVAVCCSVLQCVAVCCSVLQCVAVCCSVLPHL